MNLAEAYVKNQKFGNLFELEDALYKGTIFKDLYKPYKYEPVMQKSYPSKKERLYSILQKLGFYMVDLKLYLDTHKDDDEALNTFKVYRDEYNKMSQYYAKDYGPLFFNQVLDSWTWVDEPWPWEGM